MKGKAGRTIIVLLLLLAICGVGAAAIFYQKNSLAHVYLKKLSGQPRTEKSAATNTATATQFKPTKLNRQLKKMHFSGNVAVIKGGRIIYQRPYGHDPEQTKKTVTTKYQIGTLQNALTAAAIMHLVQEGKVNLETPVSHYYLLDNADASVTVGSLLTMTSGLSLTAQPASELNADVISWNLANATGSTTGTYDFQSVNYALLAGIVAQASGVSYSQYLQKVLLKPAGTTQTGFVKDAATQQKLAPPFKYDQANAQATAVSQATLFQAMNDQLGTDQLYTTASDLGRVVRYLASNHFLKPKYRDQGLFANDNAYTGRLTQQNQQLTGRADFSGYHSALAFDVSGKTGVVLLSNYQTRGSLPDTAQRLLQQVQAD